MFVSDTNGAIRLHVNSAKDPINWAEACPGGRVAIIAAADGQRAIEWVNGGHYTGGVAPVRIADAEGRLPGANGYEPTFSEGTAAEWALVGNQLRLGEDGTVEFLDPAGVAQDFIEGLIVYPA